MARPTICDVCRKPCDAIVAKMWYAPIIRGSVTTFHHSRYSHHLDVGECCGGTTDQFPEGKILGLFNWARRKTAVQYRSRGKRKR